MNLKILLPFLVMFLVFAFCLSAGCVDHPPTQKEILADVISSLNETLTITTDEARSAAESYAENPTAANGHQALATLYQRTTLTQDLLIADENGIVLTVYPNNIYEAIGKNLSSYPPKKEDFANQDVYISGFMQLENGMDAYLLSVPVEINGEYVGYISLSFDPYRLFGEEQQKVAEDGYNLWVMQTDGVQVYDSDVSESGVNLLTDSNFEVPHDTTALVSANPSGETSYVYTADTGTRNVVENTIWNTLTFGGQTWRVVLIKSTPI